MMLNVGELIVRLTPRAFPINCVNVVLPAPKSPLSKIKSPLFNCSTKT